MLLYIYIATVIITFTLVARAIKKESKSVTVSDLLLCLFYSIIPCINILVLGLIIVRDLEGSEFINNVDKFLDKKVF